MLPGLQLYLAIVLLASLARAQENYEDEAPAEQSNGQQAAIEYFRNFGYLPDGPGSSAASMAANKFEDAVIEFQRKMGLEPSGKLDAKTTEMLAKSRCGNKDDIEEYESLERPQPTELKAQRRRRRRRSKRFALHGYKWSYKRLLYKISGYTPKLARQKAQVDAVFERAFNIWTKVAQLEFEQTDDSSKAHLEIRFVAKNHGNCELGPLNDGVLAHAHPPTLTKKLRRGIHFNDRIDWQVEADKANNSLLATAVHEIGHALGLAHSRNSATKMFPIENGLTKLHQDDIKGIQTLYGNKPKLNQFYTIDKRWFAGDNLYDKSLETLEECAEYALRTRHNLTIFDREKRRCSIKSSPSREGLLFYRSDGTGVLAQGPDLYVESGATTNSTEELDNWIRGQECDNVVKELGEFIDQYHCKRYEQNECCTILMRIEPSRATEPILEAAKEESLASIIG